MASKTSATTDHDEIRRRVEEHLETIVREPCTDGDSEPENGRAQA